MATTQEIQGFEDVTVVIPGLSWETLSSDGVTKYRTWFRNRFAENLDCNCMAGQHGKPCRHAKRVRQFLKAASASERQQPKPRREAHVPVSDPEDEDPFAAFPVIIDPWAAQPRRKPAQEPQERAHKPSLTELYDFFTDAAAA